MLKVSHKFKLSNYLNEINIQGNIVSNQVKIQRKIKEIFTTPMYMHENNLWVKIRGATIHETMGPIWKDIIWISGRPFVVK